MPSRALVSGICVSPGVVHGTARVINKLDEIASVRQGEILVIPNSHPAYAFAVMNAEALICEIGGKLSHICIVAMEMGIPCISQAAGATSLIADGQRICIDAGEGVVYADE